MQKILFATAALLALQTTRAQVLVSPPGSSQNTTLRRDTVNPGPSVLKEGKIIYERKVNLHRRITDESMKSMVPEFNTSKTELDFSADESIYRNIKEEEDIRNTAGEDGNRPFIRIGGGADDQTYKNYTTERITELKELGPKKYIIEDTLHKQSWKLEGETRTIKGYPCRKATTKDREGKGVIAWYTENIQAPAGPEIFGGLPGLILELSSNDAEIVFTPLDIITKDFDKKIVKKPTDGKKISLKEYRQMMEEQFGANPGGRPTIRIIRN